ncbi:MAG: preprotein translocase subunit SecG [Pseudomonadota bacterium]
MTNVILVIHILAAVILTTVVLMQRSEGGALGIGGGGGGGGGGLMSGQGVKGALIRTTVIFGAIFFVTSLTLTTMATRNNPTAPTEQIADGEGTATDNAASGIDPTNMGNLLEPSTTEDDDPLSNDQPSDPLGDPLASEPLTIDPLASDPLTSDPLAEEPEDTNPQ